MQQRAVLEHNGVRMQRDDAETKLFVQRPCAAVAFDEFQLQQLYARAGFCSMDHHVKHRGTDPESPIRFTQCNGDVGAVTLLDLGVEGQMAVACKLIRVFYVMLTKQVDYDPQKMISDIRRPEIYLQTA